MVEQGLAGASLLVAPSRWMLDCIESCYGGQPHSRVIYNGRSPALFNPFVSKHNYAASVGRLWDEGKQSHLLMQLSTAANPYLSCRCRGARWRSQPSERYRESRPESSREVQCKGELSEGEMRELLSRAAIYIATSKYEPFGLAPLEAALSRCAIVANDIPNLREIWGDAACYFRSSDARVTPARRWRCCKAIGSLRLSYANRAYDRARQHYTADRMVEEYVQAYRALLERRVGAA